MPPSLPATPGDRPVLFAAGGGPQGALLWAVGSRPGIVWRFAEPGGGIVSLRLCDRGRVLAALRLVAGGGGALSGELLAWRARDGRALWRRPLRSPRAAIACAPAGPLLAATETPPALLALALRGGRIAWRVPLGAAVPVQLGLDPRRRRAYVPGPRFVAVVSLATRTLLARWPLPGTPAGLALSPRGRALAVAVSGPSAELLVLDAAGGRTRARRRLGPGRADLLWWPSPRLLIARSGSRGLGAASGFSPDLRRELPLALPSLAEITASGEAVHALTVGQPEPGGALRPAAVYSLDTRRRTVSRRLLLPPEFAALAAGRAR